ncbi:MAG: response regulator transcription factor [Chitinophagaceae bacterium]|nr:MAG: response regulator transcription factor [Chitinophagaceae bacterium]
MLRILLADDHDGVRLAVKNILIDEFDDILIEECSDTQELISKGVAGEWDIIVSDLAMPGGGGFHALKVIKAAKPDIPFIIFSTYPPEQYAARVVQAGAVAFISKDAPVTGLISTVRGVIATRSNN